MIQGDTFVISSLIYELWEKDERLLDSIVGAKISAAQETSNSMNFTLLFPNLSNY